MPTPNTDLDKLRQAEALLAQSATPEALLQAHAIIRSVLHKKRAHTEQALGPLAQTYEEAIRLWEAAKADGVSLQDRLADLERTLRVAWPKGRVWKYACDSCDDTGWIHKTCVATDRCDGVSTSSYAWNAPWGQRQRLCVMNPNYEHEYATPCFCSKGRSAQASVTSAKSHGRHGDLEDAGRSRPTRIGR